MVLYSWTVLGALLSSYTQIPIFFSTMVPSLLLLTHVPFQVLAFSPVYCLTYSRIFCFWGIYTLHCPLWLLLIRCPFTYHHTCIHLLCHTSILFHHVTLSGARMQNPKHAAFFTQSLIILLFHSVPCSRLPVTCSLSYFLAFDSLPKWGFTGLLGLVSAKRYSHFLCGGGHSMRTHPQCGKK